jgi:hypothetical protein
VFAASPFNFTAIGGNLCGGNAPVAFGHAVTPDALLLMHSSRPCRQRRDMETFPHGCLCQLSHPQDFARSGAATFRNPIRSWSSSRHCQAGDRPSGLRRLTFYGQHAGLQEFVEGHCQQPGQVQRLPTHCRRDGYVDCACRDGFNIMSEIFVPKEERISISFMNRQTCTTRSNNRSARHSNTKGKSVPRCHVYMSLLRSGIRVSENN